MSQGEKKTIQEFANHLEVSQSILSHWMNGKRKPNTENLRHLSGKLGFEVYDVLGLPRPDEDLAYITQHWDEVSEEFRRKFRQEVENILAHEESKRVHKNRRTRESG